MSSNHAQQLWIWNFDPTQAPLFFDSNEPVKFQVTDEEWHDQTPTGPLKPAEDVKRLPPYRILGSMKMDGLGCCIWWDT